MKELLRRNKLLVVVLSIYLLLFVFKGEIALSALSSSSYYLIEMVQILPVIFMLTVAIEVLVPKEWIVKRLGKESGVLGLALALAFGSLSAGPIYAAFPIGKTLYKKGASISNIVVILSAWAVIKVPMLANEAKFLGPKFMLLRWVLTVLFIIIMATVMGKLKIPIISEEIIIEQPVVVNEAYCIGCAACKRAMPEVFNMRNNKAYVVKVELSNEKISEEQLMKIAQICPSKAIEIRGL